MNPQAVSLMLLAPIAGAVLILFVPERRADWVRRIAVCATLVSLVVAVLVFLRFDGGVGGYQFQTLAPWIPSLGINYHIGLDGISVTLTLLHALCTFTGVLVSYAIRERVKEYYIFYLTLIAGVFGVFVSLDLFAFYFFYEMAVIPMFPLIGIWGSGNGGINSKEYATMKLTLYLTSGAVLALIGLLALYATSGARTFDLAALERHMAATPLPAATQRWIFPMLLVGFGVIAPMWPLHSWSPIGHAAAPSAVSMLHAGVLMKLGSYAIIRLGVGLLPEGAARWLPWVAAICLMNILYGGLVAMAQKDAKFIIGYSSSSHMGYVLLGIATLTSLGLNGAVFLMFAHGLMTALAFALIGFIYDQAHTRKVAEWGGLARQMPFVGTCFVIMAMASSGVPGFANFVSEVLIFVGAWDRYRLHAILAVFGVVITAVYMLRFVRTGFFGPMPAQWAKLTDAVTPFQRLPYILLIVVLLYFGCYPQPLVATIDAGTGRLLERIRTAPVILATPARSTTEPRP